MARFIVWGAAVLTLTFGATVSAQDQLATARELYASAAYEDALTLLNRLRASGVRPDEGPAIDQIRAFCLLALGRSSDAETAIAAVVAAVPSYQPSEAEVSPRVRTAFSDVRRKMLPGIVQQKYAEAKGAYDRKDFAVAAGGFNQVLEMLNDPTLGASVKESPLADIKTLAGGFRDLSVTAAAPPPPPPPPVPSPTPAAPAAAPAAIPSAAQGPRIYTTTDPEVVPPVVVRQALPPFPMRTVVPGQGVLEIVIDERGQVASAQMRASVHPRYDGLAVDAAKSWQYHPATLNGKPVKFRKLVQVNLR